MADEKVIIELELDDGSIKKGFAIIKKEGQQVGEAFGNNLSSSVKNSLSSLSNPLSGFTSLLSKSALAAGAVGASILAIKKSVDLALGGEEIVALNKQFEILSERAGSSADLLLKSFEAASGGLVDSTDIIKSANRALIELGNNASDLPGIFELARKATNVFGGEVTANFETITNAIASTNTRSLRQFGIFIDNKKVLDDFKCRNVIRNKSFRRCRS
jgi:hypothetical protein